MELVVVQDKKQKLEVWIIDKIHIKDLKGHIADMRFQFWNGNIHWPDLSLGSTCIFMQFQVGEVI